MKCPYCNSKETKVVDKRDNIHDSTTRRRRECLKCAKRFTTYERIENIDLSIKKKDGVCEPFSREKLKKSLLKAISRDEISVETLNEMLDSIEMDLLSKESTVVDSSEVGAIVLRKLRNLNPVAYMRFASVYKGFTSLDDFVNEIEKLK
jgi:transcriptional repressor NrdR